jgi:tight adherence protein C
VLAIICALTFLAVSLMVGSALRPRFVAVRERIDDFLVAPGQAGPATGPAAPGFFERAVMPALAGIGKLASGVTPAGAIRKIRAKLDLAGNPRHLGAAEYIGLKVLSIVIIIPVGLWALRESGLQGLVLWLLAVVIIGAGLWLPDIILQRVIEARQTAIRRSLPDVLDLLVISVEAGVGFDGAMQKVVERGGGPLTDELARVLEQVRLGKSRADALRMMGERTQVTDLISFVAAVQQGETLGVSMAKVLRVQADAARERRSQRAREAAAKLPVKLLFPLVFFIFPALFVVILGPAAVSIYTQVFTSLGK